MQHSMSIPICALTTLFMTAQFATAQPTAAEYGIQSSDEITDPTLRAWRKQMVAGVSLSYDKVRTLADAGDGLAAFKVAEILLATGDETLLDDTLHYYAIAAYTGRDFAVPPMVRLLLSGKVNLSGSPLKGVEDALLVQSRRGTDAATFALANMYLAGKPFGSKPDDGLTLLESVARDGNGEAAVQLGMIYATGRTGIPADVTKAREILLIGAASEDLSARTMAENIMRGLPPAAPPSRPADIALTVDATQ